MESGEELIDCAVCDEDEREAEEQRPPKKPRTDGRANAPTVYDVDGVEDAEQRLVEGWPVPVDGERRAGPGSGHGSGRTRRMARSATAPAETSDTLGGASSSALTDTKQKRTRVRIVCAWSGCAKLARGGAGSTCIVHGGGHRCAEPGCKTSAEGVPDEDGNRWCTAHGGGHRCAEPGCKTSARAVPDEDGNRWCIAHGGGHRCAEPGCKTSARAVPDEDGNRWCKAHSVEAVARREEKARLRALLERILAAPSMGLLALLQCLEGEDALPCGHGFNGCYVRMFKHARGRPVPDDAPRGAEASASSDGVDALVAASEDGEAEMDDAAPQLADGAPMLSLEAASEDDDVASLMRETSADAEEALGLLSRFRRRLLDLGPLGRWLTAELARVEQAMHRVITVEATLAAADAARGADAATLDEVAMAGAESLRAGFEGRVSTGSTVPAVATLAVAPAEEQEAGGEPLVDVEACAAATPSSEGGGRLREKVGRWLIRVKRHTTYPESSADAEQERLRLLSPDDRMLFLGGRRPGESDTWDGTGDGSQALFSQFVSLPLSDALPAHIESVEGCWVRLEVGTDIVAACAPFAVATRAHAGRLGMSPEAIERTVALNMSACLAACGSFEMPSGVQGAKAYYRILRVECYGGNGEESAANKTHRESVTLPVYNAMRTGHLYLQRYGHPGGRPSWGMSLRGAGRGKVLVRAVARVGGDGEGELGMTEWALTVAEALGLKPEAFHEPTRVGDVFTSQLVRLVL